MKNSELYIHIPFCVKKCDYCDFLSFAADEAAQAEYVHALLTELEFYGGLMKDYRITTVYVGGGTPSWLNEGLMSAVFERVYRHFHVADDAEVTVECNPGTVTARKLAAYKRAGVSRLSVGLQSCDSGELKLLGRIHSYAQFLKTWELAREAGFDNVNVDIISGLPYQTAEKFAVTLQQVIRLRPEHVSAYTLMIEPGTPFYDRYKFDAVKQEAGMQTEFLPTEDEAYRMYKLTQRVLKKAGYVQYEISNYARPGFLCRHNAGYWMRENYLGVGLGASSMIGNVRYTNVSDLEAYVELCRKTERLPFSAFAKEEGQRGPAGDWFGSSLHAAAEVLTRMAQMEEYMFLGLRMTEGVARADFERTFGVPAESIYRDVLAELKEKQLLRIAEGRIALTDRGLDLANYCMARFLR